MSQNNRSSKVINGTIILFMGGQILLSIIWMLLNHDVISLFGDTGEYLEISQNFVMDEYRPTLYPVILYIIRKITDLFAWPYQYLLYFFQTTISACAIFYMVTALFSIMDFEFLKPFGIGKRKVVVLFVTLYMLSLPMITFMNFSVLTDSLALSFLIIMLTELIKVFTKTDISVKNGIIIGITYVLQALLRSDRVYSGLLMMGICFVILIRKVVLNKHRVLRVMTFAFLVCLISVSLVKTINHKTQTPGVKGRVETNLEFVLLDRIVWPNMASTYEDFSPEIKDVISLKEAKKFDKHNKNVMYQMAPMVEERVGKERASEIYKEMAGEVFRQHGFKVFFDILEDVLSFVLIPVSVVFNNFHITELATSWNLHCMSSVTPVLTAIFWNYFLYGFCMILLPLSFLIAIIKRKHCKMKEKLKVLTPIFGMTLILSLWFALGDGAPPNDRYVMIGYVVFALFMMTVWGCLVDIRLSKE